MEQSLRQELENLAEKSKKAARELSKLNTRQKNQILLQIKTYLLRDRDKIIEENKKDMEEGKRSGLTEAMLDRLSLNKDRIKDMADSIDVVVDLEDPIGSGEVKELENGLLISKRRVPIGVIAMIYEARPNVTLDASILAIKSSNSIILRGGKEAFNSNKAIAKTIKEAIKDSGYNENIVNLIENTSRESSVELMKLKGYVDLLIPRGSAGLIKSVVENAQVPVLETGVGNCHLYVDDSAKIDMAVNIFKNAKTTRVGVCNAMETLLVSEKVSDEFYQKIQKIIDEYKITVYGCEKSAEKLKNVIAAGEKEYFEEFLDYKMAIKIVKGIDEAIAHIGKYSSGHSEVIVTENYENALRFLDEVDSACVYVNASSRFTDGGQMGMGAEIGISTQKLHARGPVGLKELTSEKYVILGTGQVRN
ncbi:glutamate-5-semialdehyde dehydrogenase [Peptoniphilus catoniae]|uniref:glutamate-5-semialdehyde dehydrogenase n=1 Tax=Peptoniphilus catoniae TaxID=1660341 RepID=UPI0010FD5177|nr:glutamate-5-semialdehyde dehydrogenase [Peptoniphilus catoniae]